jgi:peptidoglycan/LPS O-acetylase OafA/YrhL
MAFRTSYRPDIDGLTPHRLGFLDGLRGWGAVFVLLFHVFCDGLPPYAPIAEKLSLFIPFNGKFAVFVFFIVSGFSLTIDYLVRGNPRSLAKIAVGRYFRLAIPVFFACLVVHLAMLAGLIAPPGERLPIFQQMIRFEPTAAHLFQFSLFDVFFDYRYSDTYIGPLWTMSYELIGSFMVMAAVLVVRSAPMRPLILVCLSAALLCVPKFAILALFPLGLLIADAFTRGWLDCRPALGFFLILLATAIPFLFPRDVWLWSIGAVAIVVGSICVPQLRMFLANPFSLHCGKICFPLYLMHGPIMWIVGEPLIRSSGETIGLRFAIDLLVLLMSFAAAHAFLPLNSFGIRGARRMGNLVTPTSQDGKTDLNTRVGAVLGWIAFPVVMLIGIAVAGWALVTGNLRKIDRGCQPRPAGRRLLSGVHRHDPD